MKGRILSTCVITLLWVLLCFAVGISFAGQNYTLSPAPTLIVSPHESSTTQPGFATSQPSTQPVDVAAVLVEAQTPAPHDPEAIMGNASYTVSAGVTWNGSQAGNYGAPPAGATVTVSPTTQPSSSPNFAVTGAFPPSGYYDINIIGGASFTDSENNVYSGSTASQNLYIQVPGSGSLTISADPSSPINVWLPDDVNFVQHPVVLTAFPIPIPPQYATDTWSGVAEVPPGLPHMAYDWASAVTEKVATATRSPSNATGALAMNYEHTDNFTAGTAQSNGVGNPTTILTYQSNLQNPALAFSANFTQAWTVQTTGTRDETITGTTQNGTSVTGSASGKIWGAVDVQAGFSHNWSDTEEAKAEQSASVSNTSNLAIGFTFSASVKYIPNTKITVQSWVLYSQTPVFVHAYVDGGQGAATGTNDGLCYVGVPTGSGFSVYGAGLSP